MVTSAKIVVLVKSNIGEGAKLDNILVTKWDNANCLFRANHGCAVIKDSKGRKGILVVGGTGDKVKKNFLSKFPSKLPELCWHLRGVLGLGQPWCRVGEDAQTSGIAVLLSNGGQSFSLFLAGVQWFPPSFLRSLTTDGARHH